MQFEAQHGHVIANESAATFVGVLSVQSLHLDCWSPRKAINTGGEPFIPTDTEVTLLCELPYWRIMSFPNPASTLSLGRRNNRDTRNRNTGVFDQVIILNMRYTPNSFFSYTARLQ